MEVRVVEEEAIITGWKTDTVSIDWVSTDSTTSSRNVSSAAPLLILFIPGNPGCVQWYTPMLKSIMEQLIAVGCYGAISIRGISYAGHGVGLDKLQHQSLQEEGCQMDDEVPIIDAHSVHGQLEHKLHWVDKILKTTEHPKIIFISHSIGSYLVQRICILRPDILRRVVTVLQLMPFIRFEPSLVSQRIPLSFVAHATTSKPKKPMLLPLLEALSHLSSKLPPNLLDFLLLHGAGVVDEKGRDLARKLVIQPAMARNFFTLGCEEIRDLPEYFDVSALRIIGNQCPVSMLYCGGPDQWAPENHRESLQKLQDIGVIPRKTVTADYYPHLKHDFIVQPHMVPTVVNFCVQKILFTSNQKWEESGNDNVLYYDFFGTNQDRNLPRSHL